MTVAETGLRVNTSKRQAYLPRILNVGAAGILLIIGLVLVIFPLVINVPGKASAGSNMMTDFKPIMAPDQVQVTKDYLAQFHIMKDDFVPAITPDAVTRFQGYLVLMQAMYGDFQKVLPLFAAQLNTTPEQFQAVLAQAAPGVTQGLAKFPAMGQDFAAVVAMMDKDVNIVQGMPTYLDHYDNLVARMDRNVGNYDQANGLPMGLMPWMFIGPGALIAVLAAVQLTVLLRPRGRRIESVS
jgi:hypothetical protein